MIRHRIRLATIPLYLLLCLVLGGASAAGFWANMALQLAAIPLLLWALTTQRQAPTPQPARQLLLIALLVPILLAIQLIPLPPSLWTQLPERAAVANGYALLGMPLPWLPISLAPGRTLASALWLLPTYAVLLGIIRLGNFKPGWVAWTITIIAGLSVIVGAMQLMGGSDSPWYFYEITNYGETTGFFANANHFGTLLVAAIPFLAAIYLQNWSRGRSKQRASGLLVVICGALAILIVGVATNGSLAALGLSAPVAFASLLMIWGRYRKLPRWLAWVVVALGVAVVAVLITSGPISSNNLTTDEAETSSISRYTSFSNSLRAAVDFVPLGSGVGSFQQVYPTYENPAKVTRIYMNHVHGDYIEVALETGIPGLLIIALFLVWWLRRSILVWRSDQEPDYFARAATIASAAILTHSIVDYPLRTAAVSALFAACCALMAEPRPHGRSRASSKKDQARHLSAG